MKIEKERLGNGSRLASPSSSYGMKTPDFDVSDDEEDGHDSFNSSMVRESRVFFLYFTRKSFDVVSYYLIYISYQKFYLRFRKRRC